MSDSNDPVDPGESTMSSRTRDERAGRDTIEREPDGRAIDDRRFDDRRFHDHRFDDEVSLRDLYLILVRGLPAILLVAVLAGAAAFLVSNARPPSYVAEATVTSSSPSVRIRDDPTVILGAEDDGASTLLAVQPPQTISLEAYRALALSRDVFERTRDLLGDTAPELDTLRDAAEVESANGSGSSLLMQHRVTWTDSDTASAYANAWAEATVGRVREAQMSDLEPTLRVTRAAVIERREALEAAEAELVALQSNDSAVASPERLRLEREVAAARRAYLTVADLEPTITYLAELVPSGTRMLEPAAPPTDPSGTSTALVTALAAVLGAMVATLGVFLREAIREPDAPPKTRSARGSHTGTRAGD